MQAITQDSTILAGLLAEAPDKANFKIIPDLLSKEEIGVGVKKGEPALLKAVNDELVKLENSGEAVKSTTSGLARAPNLRSRAPLLSKLSKQKNIMLSAL